MSTIHARLVAISLALAAAAFALSGATAQAPLPDGAFALGQDGYAYVVVGGTAYPINFYTDTAGEIGTLPLGPWVSSVQDLAAALGIPPAQASPATAAGTRANPVPLGTPATLSDGWQVKVVSVTANANSQVAAANRYNSPPAAGRQFFIVRLSATYNGQTSASFGGSYRLRLVGASAVSYSTFHDSCGVIPDELPSAEVFPGGTIAGNLCWSVLSGDVGSLVMYDDQGSISQRVYFGLR